MIRNIKTPHLPEGELRHVIIGEKYRGLLEKPLSALGMIPLWMPDNPYVDERLAGHADLSINKFSENSIILCKFMQNSELSEQLRLLGYECIFTENAEKPQYPYDAGLNVCQIGKTLIYNSRAICEVLNKELEGTVTNRIDVRQGYTKCAVCIVNESSIITADKGIHSKAISNGIDSLLISDGIAELDGFDCGFIGGAAFKTAPDQIAFTGTIECSSEKNAIESFLSARGIEAVYLTERKPFDIGSAILLTEDM